MRTFLKRSFLFLFVAWFLGANVGFSWTQSTCLFTGIQKASWSIDKPIEHSKQAQLSRSTCFHYKHFQVKQQATYSLKKLAFLMDMRHLDDQILPQSRNYAVFVEETFIPSPSIPIAQSVRRAFLQVYLI